MSKVDSPSRQAVSSGSARAALRRLSKSRQRSAVTPCAFSRLHFLRAVCADSQQRLALAGDPFHQAPLARRSGSGASRASEALSRLAESGASASSAWSAPWVGVDSPEGADFVIPSPGAGAGGV